MSLTKAKASSALKILNQDGIEGSTRGIVEIKVYDGSGNLVDIATLFDSDVDGSNGIIMNQTLDTAKKIFSRTAAGDMNYKIAKIAFGNSGHNYTTPKQAVAATVADIELLAIQRIKTSLNEASADKHFLFEDSGGINHRLVYIEKDILSSHITYGPNDNQLIINVPISYDDFNTRVGGATTNDINYDVPLISYKTINPNDGTVMEFAGVDGNGDATAAFTETHSWDDGGTRRYSFKNGLDASGAIDVNNGGERPQEISEILLSTDIVGAGTAEDPYEKLATSRMTSGLLSFPDSFTFVYSWTLSWSFA